MKALRWGLVIALCAAALCVPLSGATLPMTVVTFGCIAAIATLGLNITFGLSGQLSMFHAAAFGLGGYGTVLAMRHLAISFLPALALAASLVVALAVVIGAICFRFKLRDFYFAVTTMAVSEMLRLGVLNWYDLTNGSLGITVSERPILHLPGIAAVALDSQLSWYVAAIAALVVAATCYWALARSWMGRSLTAIRINDELAEALGIDSFTYKLLGFTLGAAFAAVAGALYVFYLGFVDPALMSVEQMLSFIAMVLLGGRGRVLGAIAGAGAMTALPHVIHMSAELRAISQGAILIVVILLLPRGLVDMPLRIAGERGHA